MYIKKTKRGFTMAEMLIVVAIIGVLAAVAFIAVAQHQRNLERLERDSVAREIFIAAQNHLTMAESQGYLGLSGEDIYGQVEDATNGIYYFVVNKGSGFSSNATPKSLLDLMLPFGSIDETVRAGGSYVIRYQPKYETDTKIVTAGTVMDVFYCSTGDRFGHEFTGLDAAGLKTLVNDWSGDGNAAKRRNYNNGAVLGWYGGASGEALTKVKLEAPVLYIENGDKLRVGVVDTNTNDSLQIIVKGVTSGAQKVFDLRKSTETNYIPPDATTERLDNVNKTVAGKSDCTYVIILDDITTTNLHFADLTADTGTGSFTPGEDIIIQAIAFDNTQLSNIGYSAEITVNSLYEKLEVDTGDDKSMTAYISSIRHLENIDKRISNVTDSRVIGDGANAVTCTLNNAIQTSDLDWSTFKGNTSGATTVIHLFNKEEGTTNTICYMPVVPTYALTYSGQNHSVSNIKVEYAGDAGLFGKIEGTSTKPGKISNLALIDFAIKQTAGENKNAGALAGTLAYVNVENVIAYYDKTNLESAAVPGVTAVTGNAGGLIGSVSNCEITKSAASLYVASSAKDAGGLIGTTNQGKVSACYSGGHTHEGAYYKNNDGTKTADYNISAAAGNAGGLIGTAVSTPIDCSYSTCSVTGKTAGGFVASAAGKISNCYATGLVLGTDSETVGAKEYSKDGAFAYSVTEVENCHYFDIINEREDADVGYTYLSALGKNGTNTNITPLDEDAVNEANLATYNGFMNPTNWKKASAYDPKLIEYYGGNYSLKTVSQLGATLKTSDTDTTDYFVATHYGDWPAPEIFVINTK